MAPGPGPGPGPLWFLWLFFLLADAPSDLMVVRAHPGDEVILPCQTANTSIRAVEWTRDDLKPKYVLYYSDGHLDPYDQHPSYKDRVDVVDRDLKDGNVSLILKNVNINDAGTYECRVASGGFRRKKRNNIDSEPIRIIRLQVTEPGSKSGSSMDENSRNDVPQDGNSSHTYVCVPVFLILVAAAVVGVCIGLYKKRKERRPGPPPPPDETELAHLQSPGDS